MIYLQKTINLDLVKRILTTPGLYEEIKEDGCLDINPDSHSTYLIAYEENEILGLIVYHSINSITVQGHINILPQYWGKRMDEVAFKSFEWLKENSTCQKIIAMIPEQCPQVLEASKRYGFQEEGFLKNSILRKGILQGQHIVGRELEHN